MESVLALGFPKFVILDMIPPPVLLEAAVSVVPDPVVVGADVGADLKPAEPAVGVNFGSFC